MTARAAVGVTAPVDGAPYSFSSKRSRDHALRPRKEPKRDSSRPGGRATFRQLARAVEILTALLLQALDVNR